MRDRGRRSLGNAARSTHTPAAARAGRTGESQATLAGAQCAAHAARVRAKHPSFLSRALVLAHQSSAVVHQCGRWQARDCATDMCDTHAVDFTRRNVGHITYPFCDITGGWAALPPEGRTRLCVCEPHVDSGRPSQLVTPSRAVRQSPRPSRSWRKKSSSSCMSCSGLKSSSRRGRGASSPGAS